MTTSFLKTQPLFGGAVEISLNGSFVDISSYRDVPDNQEVFIQLHDDDTSSGGSIYPSSLSLIIELLDFDISGDEVSEIIFNDLSDSNEARELKIMSKSRSLSILENIPGLAESIPKSNIFGIECHKLVGLQYVPSKSIKNDNAYDIVLIILAVIRLPSVKTDISISVNVPLRAIISDSLLPLDFSKEDAKTLQEVEEILITTLKDFKIRDWELFS
jgi:hypothetical protein